jgi:hypothetical protein
MTNDYEKRTLEARLAARVEIDSLSGCHLWQGSCNRGGYPTISLQGTNHLAHRLAWTLRYGAIPPGLELCHRCDEPRCVNPDHHFVGTHQDNMADRRTKRRARLERALADKNGADCLEPKPAELTPIRIYVRGVEITGKVAIRPFDPRGKF